MTRNENFLSHLFRPKSCESGIIVNYFGDLVDERRYNTICIKEFGQSYTVEDICFKIARSLDIAALTYPLFALAEKDGEKFIWLNPKDKVECLLDSVQHLFFRIRYIPPSSGISAFRSDIYKKTLTYLFYQMREDFLLSRIAYQKDITEDEAFSKSLGLAVINKIIYGKEKNLGFNALMRAQSRQFIPDKYKARFDGILSSKKLENNFKPFVEDEYNKYKDREDTSVKRVYIEALLLYCENYGSEEFRFKSGADKETLVTVHPYDQNHPGFKIIDDQHGKTFYHSRIEDLMDISINDMPGEAVKIIHINRKQGQPFVLKCDNERKAMSLVTLLDGYFRLMGDYMHSLCISVETQFVKNLKMLKCHGPVSKSWSKQRLAERHRSDKRRNFLLKLSQEKLGNYVLIYMSQSGTEHFCKISHDFDKRKLLVRTESSEELELEFDSMPQLLEHFRKSPPVGFDLNIIVPPSDPLDPCIYLCSNARSTIDSAGMLKEQKKAGLSVISSIDLKERIGQGAYTEVFRSSLSSQDVAVKKLKSQYASNVNHFCDLVHRMSFLGQCNTVVSVLAVCLMHPVTMVMEFAPFGDLATFLRSREKQVTGLQIQSAAEQIAQALYHLQEVVHEVHGNIQCRNILVFRFEEQKVLLVKLADPGIIPFLGLMHHYDNSNAWLAPECRGMNSLTLESDRFAFGTTLWEMYNFGKINKISMDFGDLCLPQPKHCPEEMFSIIRQCWDPSPDQRISIKDIVRDIRQCVNKGGGGFYNIYDDPGARKEPAKSGVRVKSPITSTNGAVANGHQDSCTSETPLIGRNSDRSSLARSTSEDSHLSNTTSNTTVVFSSGDFGILNGLYVQGLISKHQLRVKFSDKPLGQGHYGEVYKGEFTGDDGKVVPVAVKCLKKSMYYKYYKEFEKEFRIMESLKHENIVQVIGRCDEFEESPQVLVLEFVENGCLRDYLKKFKDTIDFKQLLRFGYEIALGMLYLANQKIVHRDLAARNVLVTHGLHMKIADFGLSRVLSRDRDYYRSDGNKELPAPWCAPESLLNQQFTEKTDVWSYGVTLWEILSYGGSPQFCEVKDLVLELHRGSRLPCPKECPQPVYTFILKHCWEYYPRDREDFQTIVKDYQRLL